MISSLLSVALLNSPMLIYKEMPEIAYTKRTADYDYAMGFG